MSKFFGGKSSSGVPAAGTQQPASGAPMTGQPQWDAGAWKTALGYLEKRAAGQGLISQQQAGLQQQQLQQTLMGSLGANYDPAQGRAALNAAAQGGANIAGQAAVAGAQEQLGYQQALAQALLGQGDLGAKASSQQNALYALGQQQRQQSEQSALARQLEQQLANQKYAWDNYNRQQGGSYMQQALTKYGQS